MRFIREMIARKASGHEEEKNDFGIEGMAALAPPSAEDADDLMSNASGGFEDELEAPEPFVDEAHFEEHANEDEPAGAFEPVLDDTEDGFDEEAELDALDAAFPDIDPSDEKVEHLFPPKAEEVAEKAAAPVADTSEPDADEPMPQLTAEDIERAMQNRKKIWHNLPDDEVDPMAGIDETNDAVTRPIHRPMAMRGSRPVSVPLELVNPIEEAPAMEAPSFEAAAPAPEMHSMIEPEVDHIELLEAEDVDQMEVVVDEVQEEDEEVLWPQARPAQDFAEEVAEPQVDTPVAEEPAIPTMDAPDIQALMARAALEAAGNTETAGNEPAAEEAQPKRRAGRVKTRLLGFQAEEPAKDIFESTGEGKVSEPDMFPVGWMVVVAGPGRGASFSLDNGVSMIGRGEDQTVRLDFGDNSISRNNHASIAFDDEANQFFLGHGGKSNIVRLNNKPVLSTEELSDGDQIRLGETTLRFAAFCGPNFSWAEGGNGASDAANG